MNFDRVARTRISNAYEMFQLLAEYFKSVFSETDLDRSPLDLLSFLCHHGHHFIDQTREGSGQSDASIVGMAA